MRRAFIFDCALEVADHYQLNEDDIVLHILPVHHTTGIGINFFPSFISGSRIEFRSGGSDEKQMWERWKHGAMNPRKRLTIFSGIPTIYMRMRRYYRNRIHKLPANEVAKYVPEAMVVGVADEYGQRVAALISLQEEEIPTAPLRKIGASGYVLSIDDLGRYLRERIAGYKLPTLLRIADRELPKTVTGKVQKKSLGPRFFPADHHEPPEVQKWVARSTLAKL